MEKYSLPFTWWIWLPIGGGSSMDCGKSIALLASNPGTVEEMQNSVPTPATTPVIAVPTTAGTGSETNNACVITNTRLGRKTYVLHPSITPAFSVLDPDLTIGLPTYPTATFGFDVLTHAVEAFVSVRANAYSDAIALEAIRKVAGLGSAHGTGHAISARLNAAHGQTLATMLPHVMEYNMSVREEKYAEVARILPPSGAATGAGAIDAVLQLRTDIGIDRSITELGGEGDLLSTLMEDAMADPVNWTNPRPMDQAGFEAMYSAAW